MDKQKRRKLEAAGWKIGDVQEFLELTEAEAALVKMRVNLALALRKRRLAKKISQQRFAAAIGSSQSRVAKMEAGDPSVSLDLLIRSLVSAGSTNREIAKVIEKAS